MRHRVEKRVPFGHCDPATIVYYPRYFEWFHDLFEAMFEPIVGASYAEVVARHETGYPAVQVACEYKGPAGWGDLVTIEVFASRLGTSSMTFEYRVRKDGRLLATASVKVATMHMTEHRSVPIPEEVRTAFAPYVEPTDDELPDTSRIR